LGQINKAMVNNAQVFDKESTSKKPEEGEGEREVEPNRGKLLIDATVAPADVKYPTDVDLLDAVRKDTEKIIDKMHEELHGKGEKKPRTYRKQARKEYLNFAKRKKNWTVRSSLDICH